MKILFAYFGQPRFVYENMPNHIKLIKQLQDSFVSYEGVEIDMLFATTPIDDDTLVSVKKIIPSNISVDFDFILELDRAKIAEEIQSKLKFEYFFKQQVLRLCHQIISVHMLSSKIKKQYDAIYILRTDILFCTYKNNFDFSFLSYFIDRHDLENKIYVTNMSYIISERMPPIHVNDKIFLTNNIPLKQLYVDDFQESVASFLDDSYFIWKEDTINQINDYHTSCFRFMSNTFNSNKLKNTKKYFMINQHNILPPNSITRYAYPNVSTLDSNKLHSVIKDTESYDTVHTKNFHIPPEWFE